MNNHYTLEVEDSTLDTITAFLRGLLEKGIVDALLVPQRAPAGDNVVQTLITDPAKLENVDPIAPVLPVNSAKLVSDLTETGAVGRLGAVLRSCEVRALIELVKLKQASLDNVVLIGVDCLGTYEMNDYAELAASGNGNLSTGPSSSSGGASGHRSGQALRTSMLRAGPSTAVQARNTPLRRKPAR